MNPLTYIYRKLSIRNNRRRFAAFGDESWMDIPLRINGANRIWIGNHVSIHYLNWLACLPLTNCVGGVS